MGLFVSAYELLNEVELTGDAIKCLYLAGRPTQAIKLAERFLNESLDKPEDSTLSDSKKRDKSVN